MSRSTLYVRFPDGEVRFGIFNDTVGVAVPPLFDTEREAWDWWGEYYGGTWVLPPAHEDRDIHDVELALPAVQYWRGLATRHLIVGPIDPYDADQSTGLPDWLEGSLAEGWRPVVVQT